MNSSSGEQHSPFFILVPILVIAVNVGWLTIGSYTARAARAAKYPPTQFVVDFLFISGLIYMMGFLYVQLFTDDPMGWDMIFFVIVAGFFAACAFLCLNAAMLSGKGALAMAITQTQGFFWLLLEMAISLRVPFAYEVFALFFGIGGAAVIALAKK